MNEHCRDLHRKFYMKVNMKRIIFKKCVSFGNNGYSHVILLRGYCSRALEVIVNILHVHV